jgi:hypothetical protein
MKKTLLPALIVLCLYIFTSCDKGYNGPEKLPVEDISCRFINEFLEPGTDTTWYKASGNNYLDIAIRSLRIGAERDNITSVDVRASDNRDLLIYINVKQDADTMILRESMLSFRIKNIEYYQRYTVKTYINITYPGHSSNGYSLAPFYMFLEEQTAGKFPE